MIPSLVHSLLLKGVEKAIITSGMTTAGRSKEAFHGVCGIHCERSVRASSILVPSRARRLMAFGTGWVGVIGLD